METKPEVKFSANLPSKSSSAAEKSGPALPKDAQVMVSILKDMGVSDFDPRVVNQLLEFSYRYATNIMEDSKVLSGHAKKQNVDIDDVKLAVAMYSEQNLTSAPSRETLLDMARIKNNTPLPPPRKNSGMRLPPDRHCLTACNYRLKFKPKPGRGGGSSTSSYRPGAHAISNTANNTFAMMAGSSRKNSGMPATKVISQLPSVGAEPPQFVINNATSANVPKPTIKMSTGPGMIPAPKIQLAPQQPVFKMTMGAPSDAAAAAGLNGKKRKADDMVGFN